MSVLVAYFIAGALPIFKSSQEPVDVKTVDEISTAVDQPNPSIFNKDAINPTVEVLIGGAGTPQ
ncbi:hypothetical protein D3C79_785150 [compost metagenome]